MARAVYSINSDGLVTEFGARNAISNVESIYHVAGRKQQLSLSYDMATAGTKFAAASAAQGDRFPIPTGSVVRSAWLTVEEDLVPDDAADTITIGLKNAAGVVIDADGLITSAAVDTYDVGETTEGSGAVVNGPALTEPAYIMVDRGVFADQVNTSVASGAVTSGVSANPDEAYTLSLVSAGSDDVVILDLIDIGAPLTASAAALDTATTTAASALAAAGYTTAGTFAAGTRTFSRPDGVLFEIVLVTTFTNPAGSFAEVAFVGEQDNGDPDFVTAATGKFHLLVIYDEPVPSQRTPSVIVGEV